MCVWIEGKTAWKEEEEKKKIHVGKNAHACQDKAAVCFRARQLSHLEIDKWQQEGNMARQKEGENER